MKQYQCSEEDCQKWFDDTEQNEFEFPCSDCGSHFGVKCPHCGMSFDLVYEKLEEREVQDAREV